MIGNLDAALSALLAEALPALFGGSAPPVHLTVESDDILVHSQSDDPAAGELRPDDRTDTLPFDRAKPQGPYRLPLPPYPGPRRIRLILPGADAIFLRPAEAVWDPADPRNFTLQLDARRDVSQVTGVEVLYGVVSAFTQLAAAQTLGLSLASSDAALLGKGSALAIAVLALNRQRLIDQSAGSYGDGDYQAGVVLRDLRLVEAAAGASGTYLLTLRAELELKASRALADGGGTIKRTAIDIALG